MTTPTAPASRRPWRWFVFCLKWGGILLLVGVLGLAALLGSHGYRLDNIVCVMLSRTACGKYGVVDAPGDFREMAAAPFFFSIGRQLKHGTSIDENAPTLFTAEKTVDYVFTAPDQQKAAVVSGQTLYLVEPGKPPVRLLENSIAPQWVNEEIPYMQLWGGKVGKPSVPLFYKAVSLQWDAASRYLYIVRIGESNSLMRLDTRKPSSAPEEIARDVLEQVKYFLVGDRNLCLERRREGAPEWRCVTPQGEFRLDSFADGILRLENGATLDGSPFLSFHANSRDAIAWMHHNDFFFQDNDPSGDKFLYSADAYPHKPIFRLKTVKFSPLRPDGFLPRRTAMLLGGRYLFLSFLFGDFLVDRDTGLYRTLPEATKVYVNLNSTQSPAFTARVIASQFSIFHIP
jgi:hypothetical protein